MEKIGNNEYWDAIYESKTPRQVSWTQDVPETSIEFVQSFDLPKNAKIIDVGGGESKLVDYLLDKGYENITVLDISAKALEKAKKRLGDRANKINWIVSDITEFVPNETYDFWHDRATFHFLITTENISKYISIVEKCVTGFLMIGTFSTDGPEKCSGLLIKQYDEQSMTVAFEKCFDKLLCKKVDHITPFNTKQNFLFCSFKRK